MFFRFFCFTGFIAVIISAGCGKEGESQKIPMKEHVAEIKTSSPSYKDLSYDRYEKEWKKHDTFMEKGRERSAYDVVKKIIEKAQKEDNAPQLVKALISSVSFKKKLEDKNFPELIEYFENFVEEADFPAKNVLLSYLAQMYRSYYIRNSYKIMERKKVEGRVPDNIDEWDMETLYDKTKEMFFASLDNPELKRIKAGVFDEILEIGTMPRIFRPSLFDILSYRVLDFLIGNDPYSYGFGEQKEPPVSKMLFSLPENFVFTDFSNITEDENYLRILELFKELILHHLKTGNEPATVYANLRRLSFVRKTSGVQDVENLYAVSLERMKKNYNKNREALSLILYHMADYQCSVGDKWHAGADDSFRMGYRKAADICENVVENYSETSGEKKCRQILGQINKKTLSILTEPIVCPGKPSLVKISYRNVNDIHFKLFKIPEKWRGSLSRHSLKSVKLLKKMLEKTPMESWKAELPDDGDMQQHSTEFVIPEVRSGEYLLAASSSPDFNTENDDFFHLSFTVSQMTFSQRDTKKGAVEITVSDSCSGHFLPGVSVRVLNKKYNRKTASFSENEIIRGKTDRQGSMLIKKPNCRYCNLLLRLKKDDDILKFDFRAGRVSRKRDKIFTRFFTDRSIYRPGQTVRFKAVHFSRRFNREPRLLKNRKITVTFYGSNRKKIDEKTFQTNEFGSFSGEFKLPDNMMTAYALISDSHGSVNIAVEEYKRPEFSVSMSPVKKTYLPGSEIPVEGTVETFSGIPVSAASVSYSVEQSIAPFMHSWKHIRNRGFFGNFIRNKKKLVAHGEVVSGKNGKFNFSFTSESIDISEEDFSMIHRYVVKVRVTDSRGETRKAEKVIRVGNKSMRIVPRMPDTVQRNTPFELSVRAENLNGEVVSASGELEIYRIERNDLMFKKRLWDMPDRKSIPKDEFSKLFPKMHYARPEQQYEKREKIFSEKYNTDEKDASLKIVPDENWSSGDYIAIASARDSNGKTVKGETLFVLYDPKAKKMGVKREFAVFLPREIVKPGETAQIITGSYLNDAEVKFTIDHGAANKPQTMVLSLDGTKEIIDIDINESHRGGVVYSWLMCRNNRCKNGRGRISVPWDNKKLDIKLESFREILKPGAEETWKLSVSSPEGKKQTAEFLATLFDSSLETYREHNWSIVPHVNYRSNIFWRQKQKRAVRNGGSWNITSRDRPLTVDTFRIFDPAIFIPVNNNQNYGISPVFFSGPDIIGGGSVVRASGRLESVSDKKRERTDVSSGRSDGKVDTLSEQVAPREKNKNTELSEEEFREDFAETVLFITDKYTDNEGNLSVSFKIPDRLTRWKMYGMAHTSDFKIGQIEKELVTRKEVMIKPNIPRFLRSGDKINLVADILNITGEEMPVEVSLEFINPVNGKSANEDFITDESESSFTVDVSDKTTVSWEVSVPDLPGAVEWRISATGEKHKDAVKSLLPVLSDKIQILDTTPLFFKEKEMKTVDIPVFEENYSDIKDISFEYTSNPSWHVVF
ncbi:MAG: alpha-2-macroglobulin family protein, partial [bacterium]